MHVRLVSTPFLPADFGRRILRPPNHANFETCTIVALAACRMLRKKKRPPEVAVSNQQRMWWCMLVVYPCRPACLVVMPRSYTHAAWGRLPLSPCYFGPANLGEKYPLHGAHRRHLHTHVPQRIVFCTKTEAPFVAPRRIQSFTRTKVRRGPAHAGSLHTLLHL